ncbi:helix-hairpin-helix domain-containing protein, partial [Chloroflexota bacterium]
MTERNRDIERLQSLRNIGPVIASRLYDIGIKTPEQLKRATSEELYEKLKM